MGGTAGDQDQDRPPSNLLPPVADLLLSVCRLFFQKPPLLREVGALRQVGGALVAEHQAGNPLLRARVRVCVELGRRCVCLGAGFLMEIFEYLACWCAFVCVSALGPLSPACGRVWPAGRRRAA